MNDVEIQFTTSLEGTDGSEFLLINDDAEAFAFLADAGVNPLVALAQGPEPKGTRSIRFEHEGRQCLGLFHWGEPMEADNGFQVLATPVGASPEMAGVFFDEIS
jgi:hypothetical protein